MSNDDCREELAQRLAAARKEARQIPSLESELVPATPADAYRVNNRVAELLGWTPLGWKIAATTEELRIRLKTDGPIYGRTYRRFLHASPARFSRAELLDPIVECEFFVTLGHDLPPRAQPWSVDEVKSAVSAVHAGIEIAECRFPSSNLPPLPAILADGSASGRYVVGGAIADWRQGLNRIEVRLERDGQEVRRGSGSDVMGDPILPLHWLAEERRRFGDGLKAGETISTGSMTGMLAIRRAQHIRARFGTAAEVEITFET